MPSGANFIFVAFRFGKLVAWCRDGQKTLAFGVMVIGAANPAKPRQDTATARDAVVKKSSAQDESER